MVQQDEAFDELCVGFCIQNYVCACVRMIVLFDVRQNWHATVRERTRVGARMLVRACSWHICLWHCLNHIMWCNWSFFRLFIPIRSWFLFHPHTWFVYFRPHTAQKCTKMPIFLSWAKPGRMLISEICFFLYFFVTLHIFHLFVWFFSGKTNACSQVCSWNDTLN